MSNYFDLSKVDQIKFIDWMGNNYQEKWLTDYELEQHYDDMLDECYPDLTIAGYEYSTSSALKEVDPTTYRCGYADYTSERYIEIITLDSPTRTLYLDSDDRDDLVNEFLEYQSNLNDGEY